MNKYYDETIGSYVSNQEEADAIMESWIVSQMTQDEKIDYEVSKQLEIAFKNNYNLGGK